MNNKILSMVIKGKLLHYDVPNEFKDDFEVIKAERIANTRSIDSHGYDVIKDRFFVTELIYYGKDENGDDDWHKSTKNFESFNDYFCYIDGASLKEKSCFFKMDDSKLENCTFDDTTKQKLISEIHGSRKSLTEDKYYNYTYDLSEEKEKFKSGEKTKKFCSEWIDKFNKVSSFKELLAVSNKYYKTSEPVNSRFFLWNYLFKDENIWARYEIVMKFVNMWADEDMAKGLCLVYGIDPVFESFTYSKECLYSQQTFYKRRRTLKEFIKYLENEKKPSEISWYFDNETHYFCREEKRGDGRGGTSGYAYRYFKTFIEFVEFKGDLCDCDLSNAFDLEINLSSYKTNKKTLFPLNSYVNPKQRIKKGYLFEKGMFRNKEYFYVNQEWFDNNHQLKEKKHKFAYFFDFVSFMDGDLSGADLLDCDGLNNIRDFSGIKLSGAKLSSEIAKRAGVTQKTYIIDERLLATCSAAEKNEAVNALLPKEVVSDISTFDEYMRMQRGEQQESERRIYYISDLHLLHRIQNARCETENDVLLLIDRIAEKIISDSGRIILIGGDTSSDFGIFELFLKALQKTSKHEYKTIIFVLGNHELWPFYGKTIEEIFSTYKKLINKYGFYLLNNGIIYDAAIDTYNKTVLKCCEKRELEMMEEKELRSLLSSTKTIFFGGTAFSGYNESFNAKNGIYLGTMNRKQEIQQTKIFEKLYRKIENALYDKNVVILTHTPKSDWCKDSEPFKNFVYVNGHNHRNYFHDDGEFRIYSDNQIGYYNKVFGMKYFYMNYFYNSFSDFEDGIYEISKDDYLNFCRGKDIMFTFARDVNKLLMLKKNGYFCFLHKGKRGNLSILNGGALKKLKCKDEHYYYENMDKVISTILAPLEKYTKYQKRIAETVKSIGGDGRIHGCIVDIDFLNHIYVNPTDLKLTGYFAFNTIDKYAYESIPALLEAERPDLYKNYEKLLQSKDSNKIVIKNSSNKKNKNKGTVYLETDIYKASREIKKMQKLYTNVLSTWIELEKKELELKDYPKR